MSLPSRSYSNAVLLPFASMIAVSLSPLPPHDAHPVPPYSYEVIPFSGSRTFYKLVFVVVYVLDYIQIAVCYRGSIALCVVCVLCYAAVWVYQLYEAVQTVIGIFGCVAC